MADMLAQGAEWLAREQRAHASQEVRYQRATSAIYLPGMRGRSTVEVTDSSGMKTLVDSQDYIIFTDDLRIDSVLTIPMRGDRIIDGLLTFEVMPIDGENCFRPVDGHRQQLRIYVKLVEEQSA